MILTYRGVKYERREHLVNIIDPYTKCPSDSNKVSKFHKKVTRALESCQEEFPVTDPVGLTE